MSTTNAPAPAPSARDVLVSDAHTAGELIETARVADPMMFAALTGANDKAVWLSPATAVVSWLVARYGVQLDQDTCSTIALVLGSAVLAVWHWLSPRIAAAKPSA